MTDGRKLGLIREMMIKLYGTLPLKRVMLRLLITMDVGRYYYGAEAFSDSAREIFRKYYYVNYGYGTYGLMPNLGHFAGRKNAVITIGRYCSIAPGALRYNTNHPMDWISTSAVFYEKAWGFCYEELPRHPLVIGHDVWIGSNVTILKGCTKIGNGAVIGSGSVVTKNIPPYEICAGVPARFVRKRFAEEEAKALELSKWWELSAEDLVRFKKWVKNPIAFAEHVNNWKKTKN